MRVAVLGDIGHAIYHVGDEAMTLAVVHELQARGHEPVLLTRDVEHSRTHVGAQLRSARSLEVPWPPEDRVRYLGEIREVCAGRRDALPAHDQVFAFLEALEQVDALVVAGGGNMGSRYGWLLYERLAALHVARVLGLPAFVTGQTLGPALSLVDAENTRAELVGVLGLAGREPGSVALARRLMPAERVHAVLDDASFLEHVPVPAPHVPAAPVVPGAVVVTIAPRTLGHGDRLLPVVAAALDDLARTSGQPVHLVPHMGDPALADGDMAVHRRLAALMSQEVVDLPMEHALVAARRAREAGLVLTSRYHPAVFATAGGAATVGLSVDTYTEQRMAGALGSWGVTGAVLDVERGDADELTDVLAGAWRGRAALREHLTAVRPALESDAGRFWTQMSASLEGARPFPARGLPVVAVVDVASRPVPAGGPVVTVVMRTRDRTTMLDRALHDVASQTFAHLEVVVVNDGGEPAPVDAAVARCIGLAGRARVLHRSESRGMEAASNAGVAEARGELLAVHDDDDTWEPTFLAEAIGYLRSHPDEHAVAGRTEIVWEAFVGEEPVARTQGREPFYAHLDEITLGDELRANHLVPIACVYRARVHDVVGPYDESLPVVGDWEFYRRLTRLGPISVVGDRPLAYWHQRRDSTDASANSVIAAHRTHRSVDRRLRDARLRERLDAQGDGDLLFLSALLSELQGDVLGRLDALEEEIGRRTEERLQQMEDRLTRQVGEGLGSVVQETREAGAVALVRRKYHAGRTFLRRARARWSPGDTHDDHEALRRETRRVD